MANYKVKDTALDATATAIQFFAGQSTQIEWDDTIGFANAISENDNFINLIERTITSVEVLNCSIIGAGAFAYCSSLTTVSFPICTSIGNNAFQNCSSLTTVSFPTCTSIGFYAFGGCNSLTTVSFPVCKTIGGNAFQNCTRLTTVNFPVCTSIGYNAFTSCYQLTMVSFPACTIIEANAFYHCYSNLTTASFPVCTSIGSLAFYSCYKLTTVSFPTCTIIGEHAFYNCSSLTTASFPVCTSIGSYTFYNCSRLTTASFPVCTLIGSQAFYSCSRLTTTSFPMCTSIGSGAFTYCSSLTTVSFPVCTIIGSKAFTGCYSLTTTIFNASQTASNIYASAFSLCYRLKSLYLLASTMYKLQNTNAFSSTPISTYTTYTNGINGSIFVPQSLLTTYKASTNWVTYSARFAGLTDAQITALENGINLIKFTINGSGTSTSYFAEEGMTWQNWVNSEYNTDGLHIYDNYGNIFSSDDSLVVSNKPSLQLEFTVPNAYIQSNYTYYYVNAPGSSGGSSN